MTAHPSPHNPLEQEPPPLRTRQGPAPLWNGLGKRPVGFWVLEPAIHWWDVHYIDNRAMPCTARAGRCQPCETGWRPRRTGYVSAMREDTGGRYILRVTDYAYKLCPAIGLRGNLRGLPLIVARNGESKQSPWSIAVAVTPKKLPANPPPPFDTEAVLSMIWGIDLRRLGACPPPDGDVAKLLQPYRRRERRET